MFNGKRGGRTASGLPLVQQFLYTSFGFNKGGLKAQLIPKPKAAPWVINKRKSDAL